MSCVHYQSSDPLTPRIYPDYNYPHIRYTSSTNSQRMGMPDSYRSARGDPVFRETGRQTGRMYCQPIHGDPISKTFLSPATISIEKMQATLKFLEDSNVVIQTRNQNLITENKALNLQAKEERYRVAILNKTMNSLKEELDRVRFKLNEITEQSSRKETETLEEDGTSTTDIISSAERGVQVWAVCKACQRKLASCEKEPPTVTITKSQLELLEKDMRTLKDAILLREETWDKAMEREENYRQQLTRLTVETITARHLSETRHQEVQGLTNTLLEKESEVKSIQKDTICLNKLIAKLYNRQQRGFEDSQGGNFGGEISEKDQKLIEEIVRRVASTKSKQKSKAKSGYSERTSHSGICQSSPRDNRIPRGLKDQPASAKESKR